MIDVKRILTLLACCMCLAVARTSWADFVGVISEINTDAETATLCGEDLGLTVCNVFIQFNEDDDRLLAIGFADLQVMNGDNTGVFYHHVFGIDLPYSCALLVPFPDLICDSYVTIGEECAGLGETSSSGDFSSDEFNDNGHLVGCWFNGNPSNGLGDAIKSADGKVFVLQSAVTQGFSLEGSATVFWQNIGVPAVFEIEVEIVCEAQCPTNCSTDVNGDGGTGPFDLAALLAAWGPLEAGNCLDANDDGNIGPFDLANLLAAWGPCQ